MKLLRTKPAEIYEPLNKADVLALELYDSACKGDSIATKEILDRTEGKVKQKRQTVSRSNLTKHGMIHRIEIDYESYPISRVELSRRILWHYGELLRKWNFDPRRHDDARYHAFIESYDDRIGAPFAWPEHHFKRPENLN